MNAEEWELLVHPVVAENVTHNSKTITDIRAITASVFGVAAGILGLENLYGFAFYLLGNLFVSLLMFFLAVERNPKAYFRSQLDLWTAEVFGGSSLSGFVLTWTLFYNLVRA